MALSLNVEDAAVRYAPYIEELHEFFSARGLHFGAPDDVFPLAKRLSSPGFFREEMLSMVRAVIFREREGINRLELLELVTVAIGGPAINQADDDFHRPVHQIVELVGDALRSLWRRFPDDPVDDAAMDSDASVEPAQAGRTLPEPEIEDTGKIASPHAAAPELPTEPRFGQKIPIEFSVNLQAAGSTSLRSEALPVRELSFAGYAASAPTDAASPVHSSQRLSWLAGGCALLVVFVAGVLLRHRILLASFPQQSSISTRSSAAVSQPKPYGEAAAPVAGDSAQIAAQTPPQRSTSAGDAAIESAKPAWVHDRAFRQLFSADSAENQAPNLPYGGRSVLFISSGLMTGNLLSAPEPQYPRLASLLHVQGEVVLQAVIAPDGSVAATRILRGNLLLRSAAEDAVRQWRYRPYIIDGRAADVATLVMINFQLPQ